MSVYEVDEEEPCVAGLKVAVEVNETLLIPVVNTTGYFPEGTFELSKLIFEIV